MSETPTLVYTAEQRDARCTYLTGERFFPPPDLWDVKAAIIVDRLKGEINVETCSWALEEANKIFARKEKRDRKHAQ